MDVIDRCPICGERAHPFFSNGVAVEVPHFKEGVFVEAYYYHSHCIQTLNKKNEELTAEVESLKKKKDLRRF